MFRRMKAIKVADSEAADTLERLTRLTDRLEEATAALVALVVDIRAQEDQQGGEHAGRQ